MFSLFVVVLSLTSSDMSFCYYCLWLVCLFVFLWRGISSFTLCTLCCFVLFIWLWVTIGVLVYPFTMVFYFDSLLFFFRSHLIFFLFSVSELVVSTGCRLIVYKVSLLFVSYLLKFSSFHKELSFLIQKFNFPGFLTFFLLKIQVRTCYSPLFTKFVKITFFILCLCFFNPTSTEAWTLVVVTYDISKILIKNLIRISLIRIYSIDNSYSSIISLKLYILIYQMRSIEKNSFLFLYPIFFDVIVS